MRVERYNPSTMVRLSSDETSVDFGTVTRGQHNSQTVVLKPVAEAETFTKLALFLESNGGLNHTNFGNFKSADSIPGIEPGDARLSDFFVQASGVSDFAAYAEISDWGVDFDPDTPEYVWLDAEAGTSERNLGGTTINLRFLFEYV